MIFYFSGTGNSKGIAQIVAKQLGDRAVNIIGTEPPADVSTEEYLGFVFPVYAYAAPEAMIAFAKKLVPGAAYTFAIATFSNVTGEALQHFSTVLPLKSGYGIKMPDNFPILNKILDTKESTLEKLKAAKPRLDYVIECLREKREEFDALMGDNAHENTYGLAPKFNAGMRLTAPFWVEDTCIHCGACESMCPAGAIQMQDEKPVWIKQSCYACMACLNRCPKEAIQYGEYSKGRFRYVFRGFDTSRYFTEDEEA